jgi:hypothetical protein
VWPDGLPQLVLGLEVLSVVIIRLFLIELFECEILI